VERLRRVAVWVAALYWACCLGHHFAVAVTQAGPRPGSFYLFWFFLTVGVAVAVLNITKPAGPGAKDPAPRWYVPALGVTALICGLWPMAVGSGVANAPFHLLGVFEDTGVPGGPPGDRELNSHGRRVRVLTEEEYQRAGAWQAVVWTGLMACFSGMTLAGALYFQQGRRTPSQSLRQTAAAGSVSARPVRPTDPSPRCHARR
jgi:hypothetical protein